MLSHARPRTEPSGSALPPPLGQLWHEASALATLWGRRAGLRDSPTSAAAAPVVVVPGFLANDTTTVLLRRRLAESGFAVQGWGQGTNFGGTEKRLRLLGERVATLSRQTGQEVHLVGWSLGGLLAREAAKRVPRHVGRVVTLGSPFSGNPRANRGWRVYEWVNGHRVDSPPIDCDLAAKPPVPTIALWSRRDGVVNCACARGLPGEADMAIEVACNHMGFVFEETALQAVVRALRDDLPLRGA